MAQPPTIDESAPTEPRRKVAEGLVVEARSRIAATNRILIALFLLIVWTWLSNLSGIDLSVGKIGSPQTRFDAITNAAKTLEDDCRCQADHFVQRRQRNVSSCVARPQAGNAGASTQQRSGAAVRQKAARQSSVQGRTNVAPPPGAANTRPAQRPAGVSPTQPPGGTAASEQSQGERRQRECREKQRRLIANLQSLSTSFDILIIRLPDVHLKYHPLLLIVMIGITFGYAMWNRYKVRAMVADAVNIYKLEIGWKRNFTGLILHSVPIWLWPLSSRQETFPTDEDLLEYLSVNPKSRVRSLGFAIMVAVLAAITFHTIWMQSIFSSRPELGFSQEVIKGPWRDSPFDTYERSEIWRNHAQLSLTGSRTLDVLILLIPLLPAPIFLWASELVAGFSGEKLRNALRVGRARFSGEKLRSALRAGRARFSREPLKKLLLVRIGSFSRETLMNLLWVRRDWSFGERLSNIFRRPLGILSFDRRTVIAGGLAAAFATLMIPSMQNGLRGLALPLWRRPRYKANRGPPGIPGQLPPRERQILAMLARDPRGAMALLSSIVLSPRNRLLNPASHLRLHDLLAGLAVRYGGPEHLARLIDGIVAWRRDAGDGADPRLVELFAVRVARWRSQQGKWRRGWTNPSRTWHGIRLPSMVNSDGAGRLPM